MVKTKRVLITYKKKTYIVYLGDPLNHICSIVVDRNYVVIENMFLASRLVSMAREGMVYAR